MAWESVPPASQLRLTCKCVGPRRHPLPRYDFFFLLAPPVFEYLLPLPLPRHGDHLHSLRKRDDCNPVTITPYLSRDTTYCYRHCKGISRFPLLLHHPSPRPMPDRTFP